MVALPRSSNLIGLIAAAGVAVVLGLAAGSLSFWALVSTGMGPEERVANGAPALYVDAPLGDNPFVRDSSRKVHEAPASVKSLASPVWFYSLGDPRGFGGHNRKSDEVFFNPNIKGPSRDHLDKTFSRSKVQPIPKSLMGDISRDSFLFVHLEKIDRPSGLYVFPGLNEGELERLRKDIESEGYSVTVPEGGAVAGFFGIPIFVMFLVMLAVTFGVAWKLGSLLRSSGGHAALVRANLGIDDTRAHVFHVGVSIAIYVLFAVLAVIGLFCFMGGIGISPWGIGWSIAVIITVAAGFLLGQWRSGKSISSAKELS